MSRNDEGSRRPAVAGRGSLASLASRVPGALAVAALTTLSACAAKGTAIQLPAAQAMAREAASASLPESAARAVFGWTMVEPDARFSGEGVAHIAADERARIDLFGPRGEGYLSAVLAGDALVLPPDARLDVPVPPPALLWSTIGVFRPPAAAEMTGARQSGDRITLEYAGNGERWRFTFEDDRLASAELDTGRGRQSVELRGENAIGLPEQAVYRDHAAFRELVLTLVDAEPLTALPPEVWTLHGQ
ncbi:MAG TPA: hypothetical protein VNZ57_14745 [Longimicrobiales bacterium]|nr:hypothetical protein [Longimicrobiales bacterium]